MIRVPRILHISAAVLLSFAMLTSNTYGIEAHATGANKVRISMLGKYDSADTAAIRAVDLDNKEIRFRNHATGKTYTLNYDNTSMMYDVWGQPLSSGLLEVGQIVDVCFLKSTKHITSLNVSKDAWVIDDTRDHELVRSDKMARVKGELYNMDARTLVMADGEIALAEDVLGTDKIKVYGIDRDIYSVVVTGGHGYVSLSSDTVEDRSLVGAWLELDNEVIYKISPNMMLSAPEGDYKLQILGNGANYQSEISISRNQETVVDTSDITISKPKEGLVTFEIIPEEADVFVDGERMLTGTPQSVRYGYHNLKVMADGYITQNRYLKVGTAKSVVSIELEKDSSAEASKSSSAAVNSISTNKIDKNPSSAASVATIKKSSEASSAATISANSSQSKGKSKVIEGYKIYVDDPSGAELYFDGNYIGVVPTSLDKVSGTHEVILKRDGYKTKSYRVSIDDAEDNESYNFPDLVKEEEEKPAEKPSDAASTATTKKPSDAASTATTKKPSDAASTATTKKPSDSSAHSSTKDAAAVATTEKAASTEKTSAPTDATKPGKTDNPDKDKADDKKDPDKEGGKDSAKEDGKDQDDGAGTGANNTDEKGNNDAANTASGEKDET
ncbi:MAG: PEGA domain-containing protein [Butyrivibrio sp.]|nr:PEGA domain-containing protein [Butyrivibrio sp.]